MPSAFVRHPSDLEHVFATIRRFKFPEGGLQIEWKRPPMSDPQRNYLWGVAYKTFAVELSKIKGQLVTPDDIHYICKRAFLKPKKIPGFEKPIPGSTKDLRRSGDENAFQDYVTQIQELAAHFQIYIPDPNEGRP